MTYRSIFCQLAFVLIFTGSTNVGRAQTTTVEIHSQIPDSLHYLDRLMYKIIVDGDSIINGFLEDYQLTIPMPDSLIQLSFFGRIQPFYNEYTLENLLNLTEITLHFKDYIRGATPRFFYSEIMASNTNLADSLGWFVRSLNDRPEIIGYELLVYQSKKLTIKEKRKLKILHHQIDAFMGETTELVFTHVPYRCSDVDPFNYQTIVTEEFINSQNTEAMRKRAHNLSLVIVVVQKWDESLVNP